MILCLDKDSYISALVALQIVIERLPEKTQAPYVAALADFRRAHALYLAHEALITTPALLRRQI